MNFDWLSLKFVPEGPINNIPTLVQIMAWCRPGDKPLSEPMVVRLLTHIYVTRPQWVKCKNCICDAVRVSAINMRNSATRPEHNIYICAKFFEENASWFAWSYWPLLCRDQRVKRCVVSEFAARATHQVAINAPISFVDARLLLIGFQEPSNKNRTIFTITCFKL